ncbi:MAG: 16S rRNA (cytidine(1402)-2'-O)-methyltransferase [Myxococcales bacterium]|nr:16S rRNA (cytidine(1402)-2'-O)-methyltransferase [Myxococcales bacterium]
MTSTGRLWVVATPIGNLEDVTLRALRVLREADAVLAEDTRRTRILLMRHGIAVPLRRLDAHRERDSIGRLVDEMRRGRRFALVSDAGTPLVSDPGGRLVAAARDAAVPVEVVPGPSAVIAALVAAALPFHAFRFVGFLPRAGARRRRTLERIARSDEATVFFESPRRIAETLRALAMLLPADRRVAVCRELTKVHEQVLVGDAQRLAERLAHGCRGELTVVVEGGRSDSESVSDSDSDSGSDSDSDSDSDSGSDSNSDSDSDSGSVSHSRPGT